MTLTPDARAASIDASRWPLLTVDRPSLRSTTSLPRCLKLARLARRCDDGVIERGVAEGGELVDAGVDLRRGWP